MFEARRQHPVAAISYAAGAIKDFIVPFIVIVLLGGQAEEARSYYIIGATILVIGLMVGGVITWLRYTYKIENGELKIEYGVFVRKRHFVQSSRVQVIDISAGLIQRVFGLVSVEVKTAGESTSETTINAVTREEALLIQSLLGKVVEEDINEPINEVKLKNKDLLIAASTAGSFGIALSIIGTITAQINQFVSDTLIYDYLESIELPGTNLVIFIILSMIILAWILSLVGTIAKYSNFTLIRKKDELVISRGLFERKQLTIPYHRIQAVRVVEGVLRQPFGFATVYVDTAGYGDESGITTVLFPLIKKVHLHEFLLTNLPDYNIIVSAISPPLRAKRRYLFKTIIPSSIVIILLSLIFELGYLSLILIPLAVWLGIRRFHDAGVGFNNDTIVMRFRNLARTTAIFKKKCIQASEVRSVFFQRRRNLVNFLVTVASGSGGAMFAVKELDQEIGAKILTVTSANSIHIELSESNLILPKWNNSSN